MDPVVEALASEHAELRKLLETMPAQRWRTPTRCEGWDVADVLTHLAQTDEMAIGSATGRYIEVLTELATGIGAGETGGPLTIDEGVAAMVNREKGIAPGDLLERWSSNAHRLIEVLDEMDLSTRVMWVTGELSARTMATTRLAETWIHGGDIAGAVGVELPYTDRIVHIARLAWRTLPYAFTNAGQSMSGPVAFRLTAPSGAECDFVPEETVLTTITGTAADLCDVASRRIPASATSLQGVGPDAELVLSVVRTYA
jgi:uncharacterized protein (TIGR03084 family)